MRRTGLLVLLVLLSFAGVHAHADEDKPAAPDVEITLLEEGEGEPAADGDRVTIDYVMSLADGTEIGSTLARGRPFELLLGDGAAIEGMLRALRRLRVGDKARVQIPSALAYGTRGKPSRTKGKPMVVPPDTDLVYEITVRRILRKPRFPEVEAAAAETTQSGLKYWILKRGQGLPAQPTQRVRMTYSIWNQSKALVHSTAADEHWLDGQAAELRFVTPRRTPRGAVIFQKGEAFLKEAAVLMTPGMRCLFEVPADLAWGNQSPDRRFPPGSTTWWDLALDEVSEIPTFQKPDLAKFTTTKSGLKYRVLADGTGRSPARNNLVEVHYQGWSESGKRFDSSLHRGRSQGFPVSGVVPGFREGLQLLKEGGRAIFVIPPNLGYGANPPPGSGIAKNATLVFDVELINVK
ncbi:MAG: FKBP-type peptidyl-prolyl cis-trans isomerase [Planctomycetota bacterium]|nr:FKBP-type peptidyl-prolyl cis-trans isomerase [Planctomycetota bacterium]